MSPSENPLFPGLPEVAVPTPVVPAIGHTYNFRNKATEIEQLVVVAVEDNQVYYRTHAREYDISLEEWAWWIEKGVVWR